MNYKENYLKYVLLLTIALATFQAFYLNYITTDFSYNLFSIYFFTELSILILISFFYDKKRFPLALLLMVTLEITIFIKKELPLSPDEILMVLITVIRVYVVYKLYKKRIIKLVTRKKLY